MWFHYTIFFGGLQDCNEQRSIPSWERGTAQTARGKPIEETTNQLMPGRLLPAPTRSPVVGS